MNNNILTNFSFDSTQLSSSSFAFSILLSFSLSYLLSKLYKSQSHSLSNPETLARVFPILSIGTTIIIAVVKSSLALSLGLVGALSIVRFRTPVKEPEELTYIFLCIGIGLATGADQYSAAIIGLLLTSFFVYFYNWLSGRKKIQNLIRISVNGINPDEINTLISILSTNCLRVNFNNLSVNNSTKDRFTTMTLSILPNRFIDIDSITKEVSAAFPNASFTIVDSNY
ncbi:DUF4956 domain-containing protein [Prochlorococcus marinus]|uniref:DUF4956 domain-containing protein n=1 Tax=Prochlorococcus marinus TaxID=1219 RepID=UPI0022B5E2DB|nr:DUF4956 domain-containing protein [Prochlorococcus marinus]